MNHLFLVDWRVLLPDFFERGGNLLALISRILFFLYELRLERETSTSDVSCWDPSLQEVNQVQSPVVIQEPNIGSELWAPVIFKCLWNLHSKGCNPKWYRNKNKPLQFSQQQCKVHVRLIYWACEPRRYFVLDAVKRVRTLNPPVWDLANVCFKGVWSKWVPSVGSLSCWV